MSAPVTDGAFALLSPQLTDEEIERLKAYGTVEDHEDESLLYAVGQTSVDLWVVLEGEVEIDVPSKDGWERIRTVGARGFVGDTAVITGVGAIARVRSKGASRLIRIPQARLRRLLVEDSALSDLIVATLTARRAFLRSDTPTALVVIGNRFDAATFEIRDLLFKHSIPHTWYDPDDDEEVGGCITSMGAAIEDLPIIVLGTREVLRRPKTWELAGHLGLNNLDDDAEADVLVMGAGPGGLAAAVYAASEGLSVIAVDSTGAGGQAGTSSKIENYLGFPTGVSGRQLAENAAIQAQKFGARIAAPAKVMALQDEGETYRVTLCGGRTVRAKSIVVATGAKYQRLGVQNLSEFEGAGVYYGATAMEGQLCRDSEVAIVGGGNSAGQGAVYLASVARHVHLLIRREDLSATMSEYLIRRILETPNITLHTQCEVSELHGDGRRLRSLTLKCLKGGPDRALETPFLFLMIGALPCTEWLGDFITLDEKGFVKTGAQLDRMDLVGSQWRYRREPSTYETSRPRIYAVGDVRSGSVKRVAAAVGEGSVVVHAIHRALADDGVAARV
jgi:thioredoxin reductase (NADPH)